MQYRVVIASRSEQRLNSARNFLSDDVMLKCCDASSEESIRQLVSSVAETYGRCNVLVLTAGTQLAERSFTAVSPENWEEIKANNIDSVFHCCRLFFPLLRKSADAHIIVVGSVAGEFPNPAAGAVYVAAKHAVHGLTKTLAQEFRKDGIRVSLIAPGPTNTPLLLQRKAEVPQDVRSQMLSPETVGDAVAFVAALPQGSYVEELIIRPLLAAISHQPPTTSGDSTSFFGTLHASPTSVCFNTLSPGETHKAPKKSHSRRSRYAVGEKSRLAP